MAGPGPNALILRRAQAISEFVQKPNGSWWNGTCTQTALEVCLASAQDRAPTQAHMIEIAQDMIQRGIAEQSGATDLDNITQEAIYQMGHVGMKAYAPFDWIGILRADAGRRPILMQVANAQVLHDIESSLRDEPGLQRHAIACVGVEPGVGYWFVDPDHFQAQEQLVCYPLPMLQAAQPYGILILQMDAPQATKPTLPSGWMDNGKFLSGPAITNNTVYGFTDASGMREYALELLRLGIMSADDTAIEDAQTISESRVEQCTQYSCLVLEKDAQGVWHPSRSNLGAEHKAHRQAPLEGKNG